MAEKSIMEKLYPDMEYVDCDGILIPAIKAPEDCDDFPEQKELNMWGRMYEEYFKEKYPVDWEECDLFGVMNPHAYEVGQRAEKMYDDQIEKLKKARNYEEINAKDHLRGFELLEEIIETAREIVIEEVIHDDDTDWEPDIVIGYLN